MNVGIVYDVMRQEEKMLVEAVKSRGMGLRLLYVPEIVDFLDGGRAIDVDFALQRCVSHFRALATSAVLESGGTPVVNTYETIRDCGDKLVTTARLASRGLRIPRTAIAYSREGALRAAQSLGYPLVVKPIMGSWGRLIVKADDEDDLLDIMDFRESMASPQFRVHYLQEFIDKPGRDIRAFYVWGEVPVAIYRVSKHWKTNTARGGRAEPMVLTEEQRELVIKAGEAMGGGVLGVDLLETRSGETFVGEVNGVVEFRNTVQVTGYDLAGKIIDETVRAMRR